MLAYCGKRLSVFTLVTVAALTYGVTPGQAQDYGPATIHDSNVGFIDSAIPATQFRLRVDGGYDFTRADRNEFFLPQREPRGPGFGNLESRINSYQDLTALFEYSAWGRVSAFAELPWRFLNPEINPNANGPGDMNAGVKAAFIQNYCTTATFQFRTYIPTGQSARGLGNHHVSLEPEVLLYERLTDQLKLEAEIRYWIPIDGTDFAGDILRYGVGVSYDLFPLGDIRIAPVVEFVGWTPTSGKESFINPAGAEIIQGSVGETIIEIKAGVRFNICDTADIYAGYARPLTGNKWAEDAFRVEVRWCF
jgi:hypothetical protein